MLATRVANNSCSHSGLWPRVAGGMQVYTTVAGNVTNVLHLMNSPENSEFHFKYIRFPYFRRILGNNRLD